MVKSHSLLINNGRIILFISNYGDVKLKDDCFKILTEISQNQLRNFQFNFDTKRKSFEEFKKAQNKEIKNCIDIELSQFGIDTRKFLKLEPLTLETEIGE